ncbi:hypothetical protein HMPREF3192_01256 [Atopobium deltae]|uniref:Uncharacterized protein n=1 Tax=Atopobium deltae TaxID=1393034 RepID=A0A133XQD8_9ACTN|nr:hypothetical protein HMPREF3192_01256 [Atopobium deltae]
MDPLVRGPTSASIFSPAREYSTQKVRIYCIIKRQIVVLFATIYRDTVKLL